MELDDASERIADLVLKSEALRGTNGVITDEAAENLRQDIRGALVALRAYNQDQIDERCHREGGVNGTMRTVMHYCDADEPAFEVDRDVWHVRMLCGAEYSLKSPFGERPWTHNAPELVTCEACKVGASSRSHSPDPSVHDQRA